MTTSMQSCSTCPRMRSPTLWPSLLRSLQFGRTISTKCCSSRGSSHMWTECTCGKRKTSTKYLMLDWLYSERIWTSTLRCHLPPLLPLPELRKKRRALGIQIPVSLYCAGPFFSHCILGLTSLNALDCSCNICQDHVFISGQVFMHMLG